MAWLTCTNHADQEEEGILDEIWPGSPNALLLTQFAMCHFAEDWSLIPFALWTNSKSVQVPDDTSHHG